MASSTQDEQVHHRKEEDAFHDEDLSKDGEAKNEDDDKKIMASEPETSEADKQRAEPDAKDDDDKKIVASDQSATREQEVKDDANQEGGMTMVPSTTTAPRSLTQEEEEETREKEAPASATLVSMTNDAVPPENPSVLEIDDHQEDDSEQTMRFLARWKAPEIPPTKIIHHSLIEQCSRPIQKQLTTSDVKQRKLSLPRKKFQQLLDESGRKKETRVSVYGPDGKVHEMWLGGDDEEERSSSFELKLGWRKFVVDYGLKECCDFITVWMFRHRDSQKICLAVDAIRFVFRNEVSKRISDAAFEDSSD